MILPRSFDARLLECAPMDLSIDDYLCPASRLARALSDLMMPRVVPAGRAARTQRTSRPLGWRQSGTVTIRSLATAIDLELVTRFESDAEVPIQVEFAMPRLTGAARVALLPRGAAAMRLRGSLPSDAGCDLDLSASFAVGDWSGGGAARAAAATSAWAIGDDLHVGDIGEVLPRALRPFLRAPDAAAVPPRRGIVRGWLQDVAVAVVLRERSAAPVAEVRPIWRNAGASVAR